MCCTADDFALARLRETGYSAQDFASLGANATAATFSVINFKLLFQGNYFALSEDAQPILHYWSLAVEEQYYILFPVYLHLLMRHSRRPLAINLLVCSASFVACVAATYLNSAYAFYLLPTRAWELLAGSSLAIYERSRGGLNFGANAPALPGLALLAVSFFVLKENSHFPGWIAFMPVTGAVLVLSAATQTQSLPIRLLSH